MKVSARNVLQGTVKKITEGMINAEVVVENAGGQQVVAVVTLSSIKGIGLAEGKPVYPIVKASSVILGVD